MIAAAWAVFSEPLPLLLLASAIGACFIPNRREGR
jgi:hypothetical protein